MQLSAAGVMLGAYGSMRPLDGITREEAVVMIARALGFDTLDYSGEYIAYADSGEIATWAYPLVMMMGSAGYLGEDSSFRPKEYITRAEVVFILDNALQKLWRSGGLYCCVVEGNALVSGTKVILHNSTISGDLYIAGGETTKVILENTFVGGRILNESGAEIVTVQENGDSDIFYFGDKELSVLENVAYNTYLATDFAQVNGKTEYLAGRTEIGIDVSEWQEEIDWDAVRAEGIDFVMIRVGNRGYTEGKISLDRLFYENIEGALAAGLEVGVYFFSQAISEEEALEEACFVLNCIRGYDLTYPVVFDWETVGSIDARTKNISGAVLTDCAIAFCDMIEAAGYTPMIYSNKELALLTYDLSPLTDYDFWFAGYTTAPEFYYGFDMWQYTSSGSVAGICGRVDLNLCFSRY